MLDNQVAYGRGQQGRSRLQECPIQIAQRKKSHDRALEIVIFHFRCYSPVNFHDNLLFHLSA